MVVYSHKNSLMCLTFPSSLKGMASDWFYSMLPHFLHNFKKVTEAFLTQYVSRREAKKNNHHPQNEAGRQPQVLYQPLLEPTG